MHNKRSCYKEIMLFALSKECLYMIKLSRTGWNNIIIFSVMGFILLINITQNSENKNTSPTNHEQALFSQSEVILTLEIQKHLVIERIGRTWRSTPALIQGQPLEQMMMSWQQAAGMLVERPENLDMQMGLVVSLALTGEAQLVQFQLYDFNDTLYMYKSNTGEWYALPLALFSQLLPPEVL